MSRWVAGVVMLTTVEVIGAQSPSSDATVEGSRTRTAAAAQYRPVPGVTFAGRPALTYRLAWATSTGADSAHQVLDALFAPARVFNALRADGVAAGRIKLAIVARGPAIRAFLTDSAYRALKGIDNPPRDAFPAFVLVSRAATLAQARLLAEGYGFNPF
ncbi:MAG: hypothetical protein MUF00_17845 [Gemmatimonadaceae bacterium]|nr:hypothetical protein [Gemmatimonadaceae bacterium]